MTIQTGYVLLKVEFNPSKYDLSGITARFERGNNVCSISVVEVDEPDDVKDGHPFIHYLVPTKITPKGFLNCYELDEWYQLMEDRAYDDIANNDDVELDDDEFIKQTFYPDEY